MKSIEEIRKAFLTIHHRACGDTSAVYMSVPARPEHDADLIVSAAINELEVLRAENAKLREVLEGIRGKSELADSALEWLARAALSSGGAP